LSQLWLDSHANQNKKQVKIGVFSSRLPESSDSDPNPDDSETTSGSSDEPNAQDDDNKSYSFENSNYWDNRQTNNNNREFVPHDSGMPSNISNLLTNSTPSLSVNSTYKDTAGLEDLLADPENRPLLLDNIVLPSLKDIYTTNIFSTKASDGKEAFEFLVYDPNRKKNTILSRHNHRFSWETDSYDADEEIEHQKPFKFQPRPKRMKPLYCEEMEEFSEEIVPYIIQTYDLISNSDLRKGRTNFSKRMNRAVLPIGCSRVLRVCLAFVRHSIKNKMHCFMYRWLLGIEIKVVATND